MRRDSLGPCARRTVEMRPTFLHPSGMQLVDRPSRRCPLPACLKERGRVKRHRIGLFTCVGVDPETTTDCRARRRDRRGPGGAPAAKRGRTTLAPRSSGAESVRLSLSARWMCRWCRTKVSHPREGEGGAGSAAQACLRRVSRHGAFRATPDGLNHLDGFATSRR
jgi:hypothetical protein